MLNTSGSTRGLGKRSMPTVENKIAAAADPALAKPR
jgi:hypothetical protein